MKKNIWFIIALLFIGFSLGIITGVVVDVDTKYEVIVKKLKQKKSSGDMVIDLDQLPEETKKDIRKAQKQEKREKRKNKKQ